MDLTKLLPDSPFEFLELTVPPPGRHTYNLPVGSQILGTQKGRAGTAALSVAVPVDAVGRREDIIVHVVEGGCDLPDGRILFHLGSVMTPFGTDRLEVFEELA
jgi:hypothetical protein